MLHNHKILCHVTKDEINVLRTGGVLDKVILYYVWVGSWTKDMDHKHTTYGRGGRTASSDTLEVPVHEVVRFYTAMQCLSCCYFVSRLVLLRGGQGLVGESVGY
ncbi:hypothetical protein BDQ17DRAFT_1329018 [Cyathus striatus]|nr:hypothetical protein BDQ17DRAFT_1329018 [Cyathus striatus]